MINEHSRVDLVHYTQRRKDAATITTTVTVKNLDLHLLAAPYILGYFVLTSVIDRPNSSFRPFFRQWSLSAYGLPIHTFFYLETLHIRDHEGLEVV